MTCSPPIESHPQQQDCSAKSQSKRLHIHTMRLNPVTEEFNTLKLSYGDSHKNGIRYVQQNLVYVLTTQKSITWDLKVAAVAALATAVATGAFVAAAGAASPVTGAFTVGGGGEPAGSNNPANAEGRDPSRLDGLPEIAMAGLPLLLVTAMPLPHVAVLPSGLMTEVCPGGQLTKACSSWRVVLAAPASWWLLSGVCVWIGTP